MSSVSIRVESPLQASMAEQAVAMAKQLEAASQAAPDGKVLSRLEPVPAGESAAPTAWSHSAVPSTAITGTPIGIPSKTKRQNPNTHP